MATHLFACGFAWDTAAHLQNTSRERCAQRASSFFSDPVLLARLVVRCRIAAVWPVLLVARCERALSVSTIRLAKIPELTCHLPTCRIQVCNELIMRVLQALLAASLACTGACLKPPLVPKRLYKDWVALNSRSTTRHIMKPRTAAGRAECLALKLALREQVTQQGIFVVDAFATAAATESLDAESRDDGGLLGRRIRQGVCSDATLDRACFCSPLGQIVGPLESDVGWHLILVEERIGLEMHDSGMTRVVRQPRPTGEDGVASVLAPADPDEQSELLDGASVASFVAFIACSIIGGQLISTWASSIDVGAIADSMN